MDQNTKEYFCDLVHQIKSEDFEQYRGELRSKLQSSKKLSKEKWNKKSGELWEIAKKTKLIREQIIKICDESDEDSDDSDTMAVDNDSSDFDETCDGFIKIDKERIKKIESAPPIYINKSLYLLNLPPACTDLELRTRFENSGLLPAKVDVKEKLAGFPQLAIITFFNEKALKRALIGNFDLIIRKHVVKKFNISRSVKQKIIPVQNPHQCSVDTCNLIFFTENDAIDHQSKVHKDDLLQYQSLCQSGTVTLFTPYIPPQEPSQLKPPKTEPPKLNCANCRRLELKVNTLQLETVSFKRQLYNEGKLAVRKEPPKPLVTVESLKTSCLGIKSVDKALVEKILNEVVPKGEGGVKFSDISGQEKAKDALHEMVVLPSLRPDLFTGLRTPARGLLMFGPPGNGKTLLARGLAGESDCNLINISSASLTSKWLGEGEKMVKALFAVAREIQPTIIFIDEVDSLLSERKSGEDDSMRRIKTEFLLQFEGMLTGDMDRITVVAATNRPQELDDAALRRFTKRVYVRMPDQSVRRALINALLAKNGDTLKPKDMDEIVARTVGYSCSDITNLARDAALAPIREVSMVELSKIKPCNVRRICLQDFVGSCERARKSLSVQGMSVYDNWNEQFGDIS